MSHSFINNVLDNTGAFLHTSCVFCGVVAGTTAAQELCHAAPAHPALLTADDQRTLQQSLEAMRGDQQYLEHKLQLEMQQLRLAQDRQDLILEGLVVEKEQSTATHANFFQSLIDKDILKDGEKWFDDELRYMSRRTTAHNVFFESGPATFPVERCSKVSALSKTTTTMDEALEKITASKSHISSSTQDYITRSMSKLMLERSYNVETGPGIFSEEAVSFVPTLFCNVFAYRSASFGGLKPDGVFYPNDSTIGAHRIVAFYEVKGWVDLTKGFDAAAKGQLLNAAIRLLREFQHKRRPGIVVFLTDGATFTFFRVMRTAEYGADDFVVYQSCNFGAQAGWNIVINMLQIPLSDPFWMFKEHCVDGIHLRRLLGSGASCTAYECRMPDQPDPLVCKVFHPTEFGRESHTRELVSLGLLANSRVLHVPIIIRHDVTTTDGESVLIVSPIGTPVPRPGIKMKEISGRHLRQLVAVVKGAHDAGLVHRDIKPENIFLDEKGNIILNDWGCSIELAACTTAPWAGTQPYTSPQTMGSRENDLLLVVRSSFVMLFGYLPTTNIDWDRAFGKDTYWSELAGHASVLNYDMVDSMLPKMVGHVCANHHFSILERALS